MQKAENNKGFNKRFIKTYYFLAAYYHFYYRYLFSCLQLLYIQIVLKIQIIYYLVSLKKSFFNNTVS